MDTQQTSTVIEENQSLMTALIERQARQITELRDRVDRLEESHDALCAAREADYRGSMAVRRWKEARLPRSAAEASLIWSYGQWRLHGDDEAAYAPISREWVRSAVARSGGTYQPPPRRASRAWEVRS